MTCKDCIHYEACKDWDNLSADVQEVKHGKYGEDYKISERICRPCSNCTLYTPVGNFCINCGAKMDGKD